MILTGAHWANAISWQRVHRPAALFATVTMAAGEFRRSIGGPADEPSLPVTVDASKSVAL